MKRTTLRPLIIFLVLAAMLAANVFAADTALHTTTAGESLSVVVPAALRPGDRVAIVAPANPAVADRLQLAVELLEGRGFEVVVAENIEVTSAMGVGDGTDQVRADSFNSVARDPSVRAIICIRGGYGSVHLLQNIDYAALRRNRPIIVGYSDITAMQTAILQNAGLLTFHGPMLSSNYGQTAAFDALFAMLMEPKDSFPLQNLNGTEFTVINPGAAEGRIVGGNMTLISTTMGTPYELDVKDKVLFIEELSEAPYKLHRYMWQLKLAGKLDEAAAIVIGDILPDRVYDDPTISLKVILDVLRDVTVPILHNVRAGHDEDPFTIPMGAMVRIDGNTMTVTQRVVEDAEEIGSRSITRAEFTSVLMDALDVEPGSAVLAEPFDDVPAGSPYYAQVTAARAMGIVSGAGNNLFIPNGALTNQDMYVMLYKALEKLGRLPELQTDEWIVFDDWDDVAEYARNPIQTLAKMYPLGSVLNPRVQVTYAASVAVAMLIS